MTGIVEAAHGVHVDDIPHAALTLCRLRADPDEVTQRFVARRGRVGEVEAVLREAEKLEVSTVADVVVDTSGLSVAEVARQVRESVGGNGGGYTP